MLRELLDAMPELEQEIEHHLQALVDGVAAHNSAGEVAVKLKVEPCGGFGRVNVVPSVTGKVPREPLSPSAFFLTRDGALSRRDPRQIDLEEYARNSSKGE